MAVELIDNTNSGILDLTGGNNVPVESKDVPENTLEVPQQTIEGGDDSLTTAPTDGQVDIPLLDGLPESDSVVPVDVPEYFLGEVQVNVEVPTEISAALKDAGVDEAGLLKQLFAKEGSFELDTDTRAKLEDKYGKLMVDGYLNMYKGLNQQSMDKFSADKTSADAVLAQNGTEYNEAVGGNDGLLAMESFIVDKFSDAQIAAYNTIMESEDHATQLLIIGQVKAQMELQDKLVNGDKKVNLVGDNTSSSSKVASPLDKGHLTAAEYQEVMLDPKYWEDKSYMKAVDNARIAGQRLQV